MIRLDLLDPEEFQITTRGDLTLVTPSPTKHRWDLPREQWFRSLLVNVEGEIVSCGFPKFTNWHEEIERHQAQIDAASEVAVAEKLDGSLIIVSKHPDWGTIFRTRGSFDLGDFHDPVMEVVDRKYPALRYAGYTHVSLLFEYTSPTNQIVLKYDEPDLTLLGRVNHYPDKPPTLMLGIPDTAKYLGLKEVNRTVVPVPELPTLMASVREREDSEGVVVAVGDHLFKVKADKYVMLHALKFQLSPKKLRKLLVLVEVRSFEDLTDYLYSLGYDAEVVDFLRPETEKFLTLLEDAFELTRLMQIFHRCSQLENRGEYVQAVKTYIAVADLPKWAFTYAMALMDGKHHIMDALPLSVAAQESVRVVQDWLKSPNEALDELLKRPEDFGEEDEK